MCEPIVKALGEPLILGEGPHWDAEQQALYYIDIDGHALFKYVPSSGKITKCDFESGQVSLVIPLANTSDKFVLTHNRKVIIATWDGVSPKPSKIEEICEVDNDKKTNRFNDGKCDPLGRLYAGTMGIDYGCGKFQDKQGSLYLIDLKNKKAKFLLGELGIANGLAWVLDKKIMYYIDTLTYCVDKFDYNPDTGDMSNRQVIFDFKKNDIPGSPDGMCIDTDGRLWIACFNGNRVICVDPSSGKLVKTIMLPARQITSAVFGGPNLDILYVTSAGIHDQKNAPNAGLTFEITNIGATGEAGVSAVL